MRLPLDILDCIFGFLAPERKTLFACSKDPVLSPIIGRHAYYHIIVQFGTTYLDAFDPYHLSKLLSDNPYIVNHVRILQLEVGRFPSQMDDSFAATLLMFPVLECIMLGVVDPYGWHFPGRFRAALEDRLRLPTVKGVHLSGDGIPISVLPDNTKNITDLSLSGYFLEEQPCASTLLPQLHSLKFFPAYVSFSLRSWLKVHTEKLQWFIVKSGMLCWDECLEVLRVCSRNLINLDFEFEHRRYNHVSLDQLQNDLLESPVFPNLAQLTLRTKERGTATSTSKIYRVSQLPSVAVMVNVFLPSLRHLAIDIDIYLSTLTNSESEFDLRVVDFSPLAAVLGTASRSIPRIDLYVHTDVLSSSVTHGQLLSSLEVYEDLARSIKEGVLVIHSEKTAPDLI